jgi:hypothetical protein
MSSEHDDHNYDVTAVAATKDGRFVVSASRLRATQFHVFVLCFLFVTILGRNRGIVVA